MVHMTWINQTGSGKTYTIWGPANALLDENLTSDQQGLTPRVFQRLFERIEEVIFCCVFSYMYVTFSQLCCRLYKICMILVNSFPLQEQVKHSDKQLAYQCRCSFLEVRQLDWFFAWWIRSLHNSSSKFLSTHDLQIYNEQITDLLDPSQRNLQVEEN